MPITTSTLFCGDAIDVMRTLETGSVDAAVFDPPYKVISGGSNQDKSGKHQRPSGILTKNDGRIFAHNDISADDYLPEVYRVLRDDAHLYLMTNTFNLVQKDILGALKRAGFQVHNILVWRKNNATPNRWYMKDLEYTIFARKGRAFPIKNPGSRSSLSVDPSRLDDPRLWLDDDSMGYTEAPMDEFFDQALDWDNISGGKSHPTEKPVDLMATYIRNSTEPGETILDPFMGTGATGVAALDAERHFIGIEMDSEYCQTAAHRMRATITEHEMDIDALLGLESEPSIDALLA